MTSKPEGPSGGSGKPLFGRKSLNSIRKQHIEQVLAITGHNLSDAARMLDISEAGLRRWMHKLEIPERSDALKMSTENDKK
ncbi:MAG TPA: helix-turn-helix domain-containing protein [Candidatus Hydrogenedentes bacterium]|nr:helix-turn-helix domain-containing protein [Candidatus Hydrogenedentota bacterium]